MQNNLVAAPRIDSIYLGADEFNNRREIMSAVYDGYDEKTFLNYLESTARAEASVAPTFHHYETGLLYRAVGVGTIVGTATASSAVITLTADSYTNVGSITGNKDRSPLKATDVVMLPGGIHAYVSEKSSPTPTSGSAFNSIYTDSGTQTGTATRYTIVRRDGDTVDLGAALTAMVGTTKKFVAYSNAHAEGSYQPLEGTDALSSRYTGTMQIWKTTKRITGDAASNQMEVSYGGSNYYWNKMTGEALIKHKADIGWALMLSPGGSFTNTAGEKVQLTMGMEGYLKTLGNNYPFTRANGFVKADLDAIVAIIKANRGGNEYTWILGSTLYAQVETILRAFTVNGGISYNTFGKGSDKDRAVDLGFSSFTYNNITFHLMEEGLFNHQAVTGLEGFDYPLTGFLIPSAKQKVNVINPSNYNQEIGYIDSIKLRYKTSPKENRRFIEWESDRKTNGGKDEFAHFLQSQEGLQMAMLHKFIRVYPS